MFTTTQTPLFLRKEYWSSLSSNAFEYKTPKRITIDGNNFVDGCGKGVRLHVDVKYFPLKP